MDITREYAMLCNCKEVQENNFLNRMLLEKETWCNMVFFWYLLKENVIIPTPPPRDLGALSQFKEEHGGMVIIIPSQDQLQEMIYRLTCEYRLLQDMVMWCQLQRKQRPDYIRDQTLEKLWLKFYMWRMHEKMWSGQEWIEERKFK